MPLHPIREQYFTEIEQGYLKEMYAALYGLERVHHVPLCYKEFSQVRVMGELYTSKKSRSN